MRSTAEPLPTGLPLSSWRAAIQSAGLLKWVVLQVLTNRAAGRQRRQGIASNDGFAGVLFTGQMGSLALEAGWRELSSRAPSQNALLTSPQVLVHPGAPLERDLQRDGFAVSAPFAGSPWRQRDGTPCACSIALINRTNEVVGAPFGLHVNAADVLTQNPNPDELNAPQEQDRHNQGGETGGINARQQGVENDH